jgi:AcrR family transcriptional regulator
LTPLQARLRDAVGTTIGRGHARAKIVAAAIDAFAEHGVATTRVEDILVAADLSRRTFYQHFDDKLAVVHAIFEVVTRHLAETFTVAVAHTADPMAAIGEALDGYLELHRTDRDIVRALVEESLRADSPLFALRMRFRKDIMRTLDALFAAITRRKLDPLVSLALVSAVEGISLDILSRDTTPAEIARARAVIASLIALVCAHPDDVPAELTRR